MGFEVIRRVGQNDLAVTADGDPIVRIGKIFRGEPEVERVFGHQVQSEVRSDGRRSGLESDGVEFADERNVPHGILEVIRAEVEIVDAQRLLKNRRVGAFRNRHHDRVGVSHVVAAHDVGTVGQTARVFVIGGSQEKRSRVDRSTGDDNHIRGIGLQACRCVLRLRSSPRGPTNLFPGASPASLSGE